MLGSVQGGKIYGGYDKPTGGLVTTTSLKSLGKVGVSIAKLQKHEEKKEYKPIDVRDLNHYDVYISYRSYIDRDVAAYIYDKLLEKGVSAFIDSPITLKRNRLLDKEAALQRSTIFLPILSKEGLNSPKKEYISGDSRRPKVGVNITEYHADSPTDELLYEYRLAFDLIQRKSSKVAMKEIFPVLLGDLGTRWKHRNALLRYKYTPSANTDTADKSGDTDTSDKDAKDKNLSYPHIKEDFVMKNLEHDFEHALSRMKLSLNREIEAPTLKFLIETICPLAILEARDDNNMDNSDSKITIMDGEEDGGNKSKEIKPHAYIEGDVLKAIDELIPKIKARVAIHRKIFETEKKEREEYESILTAGVNEKERIAVKASDTDRKKEIKKQIRKEEDKYLDSLKYKGYLYEDSKYMTEYALFLQNRKEQYDEAQKHFELAISLEDKHPMALYNFGKFWEDIRCNYDKAEELYMELQSMMDKDMKLFNPAYARNYKRFLLKIRKDPLRAEQIYEYPLNLCHVCRCKRPCFCESNNGRLMAPKKTQTQF